MLVGFLEKEVAGFSYSGKLCLSSSREAGGSCGGVVICCDFISCSILYLDSNFAERIGFALVLAISYIQHKIVNKRKKIVGSGNIDYGRLVSLRQTLITPDLFFKSSPQFWIHKASRSQPISFMVNNILSVQYDRVSQSRVEEGANIYIAIYYRQ